MTTHTALLTTDPALTNHFCDVVVFETDDEGNARGVPVWRTVTTVPANPVGDRDDDALVRQAKDLLAAGGWGTAGAVFEGTPTGYVVNVTRA